MEKQVSMENEFVDYPLALRMKALGFKERVLTYFEDHKLKLHDHISGWDFNSSFLNCVSRPTYSQVFAWFREKDFGIIDKPFYSSKDEPKVTYALDIINWKTGETYKMDRKKSHEEAELACLNKLCEIAEKKKEDGKDNI